MRLVHCSVLGLLAAAWAPLALAQPAPADARADFKMFVRGAQIGTEQVSVARTAQGLVISGSGRVAPPLDVITNRCEARYDANGKPIDATLDAIVHGQYATLRTVFAEGAATTQLNQAGKQPSTRVDKVSAPDVVLLNSFLGLYEGLAARLQSATAGSELKAFIVGQGEVPVQVTGITEERIQAPGRAIAARHYQMLLATAPVPLQIDLWADDNARLLRLAIPAQSFEMAREDVASAAARTEVAPRAGDQQVLIPGNGFMLAGTISKPSGATLAKAGRYPAVVLVGAGASPDRDEVVAGVPIFAQIAAGLADAGFLVLRYDKRGAGQSGGRAEGVTLEQYGEDARAVVAFLRRRKDVDQKRMALAGRSDGGWAAMLAAAKNKQVAALVLIATPGVTGAELVLAQQQHVLQTMKLSAAEQQARIDLQKQIQQAVSTGTGWNSIPPELRRQADTPWFQSFLAFDPAKILRDTRQPILIETGDLDREVFPAYADRLAQLARSRKAPADKAVTVVHVPGVNHLLVPATTGETSEYSQLPARNVSKEVISSIVAWLETVLRSSP